MDSDSLTFSLVNGPANGTFTFDSSGSYTYEPNELFIGSDQFEFEVSDGVDTDTATVLIDIYNSAPDAYTGSEYVLHDQTLHSYVWGNDIDGDLLTFSLVTGPSNGTFTFDSSGSYTFEPDVLFVGNDQFEFEVTDGIDTDTATVFISVYNSAPKAYPGSESVPHDRTLTSYASGSDVDGDSLTFLLVTGPTSGTLTLDSNGSYTYEPDELFVGTDQFEFEVTDGIDTDTAIVLIDVYNTAPLAYSGVESVLHDRLLNSYVSGSDLDGDFLTYSLVNGPTSGTLIMGITGIFRYEPNALFVGNDQFEIEVTDGIDTDTAIVAISVYNTAPQVSTTTESILHDSTLESSVSGDDPDGDDLAYAVSSTTVNGVLSFNADGTYVYEPNDGFVGEDSFEFTASDRIDSATANVFITVYNTKPVTTNLQADVNLGESVTIQLTGADADGDGLEYLIVDGPKNGALTALNPGARDGLYLYKPQGGFNTSIGDSFKFKANDGIADSNVSTVVIIGGEVFIHPLSSLKLPNHNDPAALAEHEYFLDRFMYDIDFKGHSKMSYKGRPKEAEIFASGSGYIELIKLISSEGWGGNDAGSAVFACHADGSIHKPTDNFTGTSSGVMDVTVGPLEIVYKDTRGYGLDNAVEGKLTITHNVDLDVSTSWDWSLEMITKIGGTLGGSSGVDVALYRVTRQLVFGFECVSGEQHYAAPSPPGSIIMP